MAQFKAQYASPLFRIPMTLTEILPVGVLVSSVGRPAAQCALSPRAGSQVPPDAAQPRRVRLAFTLRR
jgi:hypothetical protein